MNRVAYIYVAIVAIFAAAVVVVQPWHEMATLGGRGALGLAAFIGLGIMSEAMAIEFAVGPDRAAKSSLAFLPLFACCIVFLPQAAVAAAIVVEGFTQVFLRERILWRVSFNIAHAVIAVSLATWTYQYLGGAYSDPFEVNFTAFVGLGVVFFAANVVLVGMFFSLGQGIPFARVLRNLIGAGGANMFYTLIASPIAIFSSYLYDKLYIGGIILVIFPLLLVRYSYLSKLQLEQANQDLLRVLVKAIETRDPYTSGHSLRVSKIARAIAEDLGLPRRKASQVETAALLHDIGKIDMDYASIIQKPTSLTEEEARLIRTHAVRGAELLKALTSLPDEVIRGVRHHHERFDGRGYPDGLGGKAIPLSARIIMLCDSIDAMLSDRSYRKALAVDQVEAEIQRCAGTQFDPDIVRVVLESGTLHRAAALISDDAEATSPPLVSYSA